MTFLATSRSRDLDNMKLSYNSLCKIIQRPYDGFTAIAEMGHNLPHLLFHQFGYFTDTELRNMHLNLGHPTLNKQMTFTKM